MPPTPFYRSNFPNLMRCLKTIPPLKPAMAKVTRGQTQILGSLLYIQNPAQLSEGAHKELWNE